MIEEHPKVALEPLEILYHDEWLVAINKPCGHLVHRSSIARDAKYVVLQLLRDQIGQHLYPVHRLDRKTSGVLLFALDREVSSMMAAIFAERRIKKVYSAIVRGWPSEEARIEYALTNDSGKIQEATTNYTTKSRYEIPVPLGKHQTSRYAEIEVLPETGRMHQIRKHMNHIRHPIIGDRPHGCSKQNRLWKTRFELSDMMLHAESLGFVHPITEKTVEVRAPFFEEYIRVKDILHTMNIPYSGDQF